MIVLGLFRQIHSKKIKKNPKKNIEILKNILDVSKIIIKIIYFVRQLNFEENI